MEMLTEESCRMLPEAHAWEVVSCPEQMNVPAVEAVQNETAVIVSEVPPLVHCGVPDTVTVPADAVPNVTDTRLEDPADAAVVPAEPGSAVWRAMKTAPEVV